MKEEAKWDLLDRIQENTEAWENDKGRKSGINYDYEFIKYFMGTDDVRFPTFNKVESPVFTMLVPGSIASIHS